MPCLQSWDIGRNNYQGLEIHFHALIIDFHGVINYFHGMKIIMYAIEKAFIQPSYIYITYEGTKSEVSLEVI